MWSGVGSHAGLDCGRGALIGGALRTRFGASLALGARGFAGLLVMGFPLSATRSASTGPILEQFPDHPRDACKDSREKCQVADFIDGRSVGIGNENCHAATFAEVCMPPSDTRGTPRVLRDTAAPA